MADYFVAGAGSNTAPYDTWAKAATLLATALAAATADGDRVIIQYNDIPAADAEVAGNTTWVMAASVQLISASNDGGSAFTPTVMGATYWLGNSTAFRSVRLVSVHRCYVHGITLRTASVSASVLQIHDNTTTYDYGQITLEDCYLWQGSTSNSTGIYLGGSSTNTCHYTRCINCTFRFGHVGQSLVFRQGVHILGGSIASAGSTPTELFGGDMAQAMVENFDASLVTNTLCRDNTTTRYEIWLSNCKLGSGVTRLASQSSASQASVEMHLSNCFAGDIHYAGEHHTALGSTIVSASVYTSDGNTYDGTNRFSLLLTTTANARYGTSYISPWLEQYHSGTSAIQPSLEVCRDGSVTAYTDRQLWSEWSYQGTANQPLGVTNMTDRAALTASATNQETGVLGAGNWTGEGASAWFGRLRASGTFTPAEIGPLKARVHFGVASSTVNVCPTLRNT